MGIKLLPIGIFQDVVRFKKYNGICDEYYLYRHYKKNGYLNDFKICIPKTCDNPDVIFWDFVDKYYENKKLPDTWWLFL